MSDGQQAADLIRRAIDYVGAYEDVDVISYSGRYMYGKECLAIDGDGHQLMRVVLRAAMLEPEIFEDLNLDDISKDSMGLGQVWYWRHIDVDDVEFDEEEEEYYE
jgi:hypothetical protein